MFENTLKKRFILFSSVAFIVTGVLLILFFSNYMIDNKIKSAVELSRVVIHMNLEPMMSTETLTEPFSDNQIVQLKQKFRSIKELSGIVEIRIWNTKGMLLYSEKPGLIGSVFLDDNQLNEALNNQGSYEVVKAEKAENIMLAPESKEYIEIYDPIISNESVIGVFEVYRSFDPIRKQIKELITVIIVIMVFGLAFLFFLLTRIISNTSDKIIEQNERLNQLFKNTVISIIKAVDARDEYTAGHSKRVVEISLLIGEKLKLDDERVKKLELAALFHDIGKLGISEEILNKPGKLTLEEFEVIKKHPEIGVSIIDQIEELKEILPIVRHHHERFSGDGYPDGLRGEDIPLEARIITLADAFDAMTSSRPYREAMPIAIALKEIQDHTPEQFDPLIVSAFLTLEMKVLL